MHDSTTEDSLWKIFDNINNWLKFAEYKNAAVITFSVAELGIIRMFDKIEGVPNIICVALLSLPLLNSFYSFFPAIKIPWWSKHYSEHLVKGINSFFSRYVYERFTEKDNLLFYGHLNKLTPIDYVEQMSDALDSNISESKILTDLCEQIIINSGIAYRKYVKFQVSVGLMLVAQIIMFIVIGSVYA